MGLESCRGKGLRTKCLGFVSEKRNTKIRDQRELNGVAWPSLASSQRLVLSLMLVCPMYPVPGVDEILLTSDRDHQGSWLLCFLPCFLSFSEAALRGWTTTWISFFLHYGYRATLRSSLLLSPWTLARSPPDARAPPAGDGRRCHQL